MFKLVVLSALVAIVAAKPSGVWVENPVVQTYSAPVVAAVPSAVSHSYRSDIISQPLAHTIVETPLVENVVAKVATPAVVSVPSAVSHTYRKDIISEPVVATVRTAPVVENIVAKVATPIVDAVPSAVSHTFRKDVISEPVVTAVRTPVVENVVAAVRTPVVENVVAQVPTQVVAEVVAPAAISHSYRSDLINNAYAYATPALVAQQYVAGPHLSYYNHAPAVYAW